MSKGMTEYVFFNTLGAPLNFLCEERVTVGGKMIQNGQCKITQMGLVRTVRNILVRERFFIL